MNIVKSLLFDMRVEFCSQEREQQTDVLGSKMCHIVVLVILQEGKIKHANRVDEFVNKTD